MISRFNGLSVRIVIVVVNFVAAIICSRDFAAATEGITCQVKNVAVSSEIGNYPEDWLPLEPTVMSEIRVSALHEIMANSESQEDLDSVHDASDLTDALGVSQLEAEAAAALYVAPAGASHEATMASTMASTMPAYETSIEDARLSWRFALVYGAICLLVAMSGIGRELIRSRRSRRQEIHEDKLERQLAALSTDTSRDCDESALIDQLQRQLSEHEQDMQRLNATPAPTTAATVLAVPPTTAAVPAAPE